MSTAAAMEVNVEARRILAVSISKLYASRSQRGGLRLHRSLLVSLVMRSARDIYHSSRESETPTRVEEEKEEEAEAPMDTGCDSGEYKAETVVSDPAEVPAEVPDTRAEEVDRDLTEDKENRSPSRKRRGKASATPDFLPSKRARLESGEERPTAPPGSCRAGLGDSLSSLSLNQVIPAF